MRANSPPAARSVATAGMVLVAAVLAPLAIPSIALAERWLRPVPGEVARPFLYARATPFAAGAHRGVDLAASPGTAVRAACGGRVVFAGRVAGQGRVVSVRCGPHRVSYLPLAQLAVRSRAAVRRGASIGTVGSGHGGLHLGVRREGDPFGYEDPLPLLEPPAPPTLPVAPATRRPRGTSPRPVVPRELTPRVAAPPTSLPRVAAPPASLPRAGTPLAPPAADAPPRANHQPAPPSDGLSPHRLPFQPPRDAAARAGSAPWPVWTGLALLLAGAAGSGTIKVRRRRLERRRLSAAHATT